MRIYTRLRRAELFFADGVNLACAAEILFGAEVFFIFRTRVYKMNLRGVVFFF